MNPRSRQQGVLVQEVAGETLLYDLDRHRAHCLGPLLVEVWRSCDGRRTPAQIAQAVERRTGHPVDEHAMAVALRRLGRARLLEDGGESVRLRGRRDLLKKAAGMAGLALVSVTAPRASEAATCITIAACTALGGGACTGQPCCGAPPGRRCTRQGNNPCNCNLAPARP